MRQNLLTFLLGGVKDIITAISLELFVLLNSHKKHFETCLWQAYFFHTKSLRAQYLAAGRDSFGIKQKTKFSLRALRGFV